MANALDLLKRVSGERIVNELELIFRERHPEKAVQVLDRLGILTAIHPGLMVDDWLIERLQLLQTGLADTPWRGVTPNTGHYLGLITFWLAGDELSMLMERLNLRSDQRAALRGAYQIRANRTALVRTETASSLYRQLASTSDDSRMIAWVALKGEDEAVCRQLAWFQADLRDMMPLIDGNRLKQEFQLKPGPLYRVILDTLRDARLDGAVVTLEDERAVIKEILAKQGTKVD